MDDHRSANHGPRTVTLPLLLKLSAAGARGIGAPAGTEPKPGFQPQLFGLGDWPKGSGMRALPWLGNVQVFAWRNDLIDNRPNTWDQVIATANRILAGPSGVYGYGIRGAAGNPA